MVQVTVRTKDGSYNYCHNILVCGYSYLVKMHLCGRTSVQSFIQADETQVRLVCGTSGKRVGKQNLCISKSPMRVYDITSHVTNGQCFVTKVDVQDHRVVLACDKLDKMCLPVHYEKWRKQKARKLDCNKS